MTFDLNEFVTTCREHLHKADAGQRVAELIATVVADREGLLAGLPEKNNEADGASSDMVLYRDADLTVLHVCLPLGMKSPPHDHSIWAVIGLYEGQEDNTLFLRKGDGLVEVEHRSLRPGDTTVLAADAIHAISAPTAPGIRALHVYGGDLFSVERRVWHPTTHAESALTMERMGELTQIAMQG